MADARAAGRRIGGRLVRRKPVEAGYALVTVLLALFLLSVALALVGASLQLRMRLVQDEARDLRLRALSDAVLAETLARLAESSYFDGVEERPFGGGAIHSEVRFLAPGRFEVLATAAYSWKERTVRAEVLRTVGHTQVVRWERLPDQGGSGSIKPASP